MVSTYYPLQAHSLKRYWCSSHGRWMTHWGSGGKPCCDPVLGGILLPCIEGNYPERVGDNVPQEEIVNGIIIPRE